MLACDNMECAIEWFHFGCVGIVEEPQEAWYCPDCVRARDGTGSGTGCEPGPDGIEPVEEVVGEVDENNEEKEEFE